MVTFDQEAPLVVQGYIKYVQIYATPRSMWDRTTFHNTDQIIIIFEWM